MSDFVFVVLWVWIRSAFWLALGTAAVFSAGAFLMWDMMPIHYIVGQCTWGVMRFWIVALSVWSLFWSWEITQGG